MYLYRDAYIRGEMAGRLRSMVLDATLANASAGRAGGARLRA
jgi:hypothetical protein